MNDRGRLRHTDRYFRGKYEVCELVVATVAGADPEDKDETIMRALTMVAELRDRCTRTQRELDAERMAHAQLVQIVNGAPVLLIGLAKKFEKLIEVK